MFELWTAVNAAKQMAAEDNRQSTNDREAVDHWFTRPNRAELPKTKCAGDVFMMDWRPIPLFYHSSESC